MKNEIIPSENPATLQADLVVDGSRGDCGKGKVVHQLLKTKKYTHVLRTSGGHNCGHTIYHNNQKVVTHILPAGFLYGLPSIIGPGCVLNPNLFFKEIEAMNELGLNPQDYVKIAHNAHIITQAHLNEDQTDTHIGTTRTGSGPAYRDKYDRKGIRAESIPEFEPYLIDLNDVLFARTPPYILGEGAQGHYLDPIHGDYPYITSSHPTTAGALLNGIPPQAIRKVFLVLKAYETYVGANAFEPSPPNPAFAQIRELGKEYGATTGRPRQIRWLDLDEAKAAILINGATDIIINKLDILEEISTYCLTQNKEEIILPNLEAFVDLIEQDLSIGYVQNITFSRSPNII